MAGAPAPGPAPASDDKLSSPAVITAQGSKELLAQAESEMTLLEADLKKLTSVREAGVNDVVDSCRESFSLPAMYDDIRANWLPQGSAMRGQLARNAGEFQGYVDKSTSFFGQCTTAHFSCMTQTAGPTACDAMRVMFKDVYSSADIDVWVKKCASGVATVDRNPHIQAYKHASQGRTAEAVGACQKWHASIKDNLLPPELFGPACKVMVAHWNDPVKQCDELLKVYSVIKNNISQEERLKHCLIEAYTWAGDPSVCPRFQPDDRERCMNRISGRQGAAAASISDCPGACGTHLNKIRDRYCSRLSDPKLKGLSEANLEYLNKRVRETAGEAESAVTARFKLVNDLLSRLVNETNNPEGRKLLNAEKVKKLRARRDKAAKTLEGRKKNPAQPGPSPAPATGAPKKTQ